MADRPMWGHWRRCKRLDAFRAKEGLNGYQCLGPDWDAIPHATPQ